MAITIDGQVFRNLQEQVQYLTNLTEDIKPYVAGTGITISGQTIAIDPSITDEIAAVEDVANTANTTSEQNSTKIQAIEENTRIFEEAEFIIDGYFNGTGVFAASPLAKVTDYIAIEANTKIYINLYSNDTSATNIAEKIGLVVFYNSNKSIISTFYNTGITGLYEGVLVAPNNAKYYRACRWTTTTSTPQYCRTEIPINQKVSELEDIINPLTNPVYRYGDSLFKPLKFNGKTAIAFGDSITAGVANDGNGNISAGSNSYINIFATRAGLALTNRAVSGSTITYAAGETYESVYTKVLAMTETPDVIIISGGTNDYNQGKELGSFGSTDKTNFYGALYQICEKLKTHNSNATVIFITPINVTKDFNGHDRALLNNYRNAIYEVATSYGFNVVNGADLVPVTRQTGYDDTMINHVDGCHPTIKGHGLYARNLCGKLLS